MAEFTGLHERWSALQPRIEELRRNADEANLLPRGELLQRLAWIEEFCENELLALTASDLVVDTGSPADLRLLRQVLAVHSSQLAACVQDLAAARRLFVADEPNGKLAVRRALYELHAVTAVYVRVQLEVVLPELESSLQR
jgi:hypothetical protein